MAPSSLSKILRTFMKKVKLFWIVFNNIAIYVKMKQTTSQKQKKEESLFRDFELFDFVSQEQFFPVKRFRDPNSEKALKVECRSNKQLCTFVSVSEYQLRALIIM